MRSVAVALLIVAATLAATMPAAAAPPLDLAGADALAATRGGGDLLLRWAAKASLPERSSAVNRARRGVTKLPTSAKFNGADQAWNYALAWMAR